MANEMSIFENEEFGKIRGMMIDDEPWFVGKDVAAALGYGNTKDAVASHVEEEDRRVMQKSENATLEIPNRGLTIINESGLYSLIFGSKLDGAKRFKHWVTSEVLPSIRKTGGYSLQNDQVEKASTRDWVSEMVRFFAETNRGVLESQEVTENVKDVVRANLDFARFLYDSEHPTKSNEVKIEKPQPQSTPPLVRHTVSFELTGDAYRDALVNATKKKWTATEIAKDYGMSARDFNIMLRDFGIQHKEGKVWRPNDEYAGNGFDAYSEVWNENYEPSIMFWTRTGRLFLYDFLKEHGKSPKTGPVVDEAA